MKNSLLVGLVVIFVAGCVSVPKETELEQSIPEQKADLSGEAESFEDLKHISDQPPDEELTPKGVIFAKTDFQGLLETRYVKLFFEDHEKPDHKFQVHIGESSGQQSFPWDVKSVKPGYFLVEVPAGRYTITTVTIPVGTATATEAMNVTLEVLPETVTYVGTLRMVGTKERYKLGGVPVIKPGFEYTVAVLDERDEGTEILKRNYPDYTHGISVQLMEVHELATGQGHETPAE